MKHNSLKAVGILAVLLINLHSLTAQDTARNLSLKEAIDLSIKNSKQLKNSQAKIEEATAALKEAVQKRLPDAGIGGTYMYVTQPDINLKVKSSSSGGSGGSGGGINLSAIKISQAM